MTTDAWFICFEIINKIIVIVVVDVDKILRRPISYLIILFIICQLKHFKHQIYKIMSQVKRD